MNVSGDISFLVVAGPDDLNRSRWIGSVDRALREYRRVHLYLVDRGVLHLLEGEVADLSGRGVRLYACAYGCGRYGVPLEGPATFSGLMTLCNLLMGCERFVSVAVTLGGEETIFEREGPAGRSLGSDGANVVVYLRGDPGESHLPVEGLRIAAGLAIGSFPLAVVLSAESTPLLYLGVDEVVDGDRRDGYLDIMRGRVSIFHKGREPGGGKEIDSRRISGEEEGRILEEAGPLIVI